jgi:hypothetical protein
LSFSPWCNKWQWNRKRKSILKIALCSNFFEHPFLPKRTKSFTPSKKKKEKEKKKLPKVLNEYSKNLKYITLLKVMVSKCQKIKMDLKYLYPKILFLHYFIGN